MSRAIPAFIADGVAQFADKCSLTAAQVDALTVIVRVAFENGIDRGRVEGAEAVAALRSPGTVKGGAA